MNRINIIDFHFNLDDCMFSLELNIMILCILIMLFFLIRHIVKVFAKSDKAPHEIVPVKLTYNFGGAEVEYSINRNYQNIEIAHRIYIEIVTRKAALELDTENDVIVEVYNSWYALFQTTREELKKLSGDMLLNNSVSKDLIKLLTDILNKGLRPHLTEYQAKFRKWYSNEISKEENILFSPQYIQKKYEKYSDLIGSMKTVNELLMEYALNLDKIINGDKDRTTHL